MNFFYKESKSKEKKEKNTFFVFCVGCVGEGGGVVSDFFLQRIEIYTILFFYYYFFFFFGGGGMEAVLWRGGSAARVSEFFLQIIQI